MNLECSSKGDRRFSALYARVKLFNVVDSIENFYQQSKRDVNGNIAGKGKKAEYLQIRKIRLPIKYATLWYKYLWYLYFVENPMLIHEIKKYDTFTDMFKGKSINCQADVIAQIKEKGLLNLRLELEPFINEYNHLRKK